MARAREAKRLKLAHREIVRRKVEGGLPITDEERVLLGWKGGARNEQAGENQIIAAAAKLVLKPQSVNELRLLVEKTAAKHHYNPIESLIQQTQSTAVDEKDKIAIHKALLPFLCPVLSAPKMDSGRSEGVKVVVTQFHFPERSPARAIHEEKPKTVTTTYEQQ